VVKNSLKYLVLLLKAFVWLFGLIFLPMWFRNWIIACAVLVEETHSFNQWIYWIKLYIAVLYCVLSGKKKHIKLFFDNIFFLFIVSLQGWSCGFSVSTCSLLALFSLRFNLAMSSVICSFFLNIFPLKYIQ